MWNFKKRKRDPELTRQQNRRLEIAAVNAISDSHRGDPNWDGTISAGVIDWYIMNMSDEERQNAIDGIMV